MINNYEICQWLSGHPVTPAVFWTGQLRGIYPPMLPPHSAFPSLNLRFSLASCLLCLASLLSRGNLSVIMVVTGAECKYVVNTKGQDLGLEWNPGRIKPWLSQHIFFFWLLWGWGGVARTKTKERSLVCLTGDLSRGCGPRGSSLAPVCQPTVFLTPFICPCKELDREKQM